MLSNSVEWGEWEKLNGKFNSLHVYNFHQPNEQGAIPHFNHLLYRRWENSVIFFPLSFYFLHQKKIHDNEEEVTEKFSCVEGWKTWEFQHLVFSSLLFILRMSMIGCI